MDREGGPIDGDPQRFVAEMMEQAERYDLPARAPALADRPLLLVAGERDEALPKSSHHDRVASALRTAGAKRMTELVYDDDHFFSAHRIELARRLVDWQQVSCWARQAQGPE